MAEIDETIELQIPVNHIDEGYHYALNYNYEDLSDLVEDYWLWWDDDVRNDNYFWREEYMPVDSDDYWDAANLGRARDFADGLFDTYLYPPYDFDYTSSGASDPFDNDRRRLSNNNSTRRQLQDDPFGQTPTERDETWIDALDEDYDTVQRIQFWTSTPDFRPDFKLYHTWDYINEFSNKQYYFDEPCPESVDERIGQRLDLMFATYEVTVTPITDTPMGVAIFCSLDLHNYYYYFDMGDSVLNAVSPYAGWLESSATTEFCFAEEVLDDAAVDLEVMWNYHRCTDAYCDSLNSGDEAHDTTPYDYFYGHCNCVTPP